MLCTTKSVQPRPADDREPSMNHPSTSTAWLAAGLHALRKAAWLPVLVFAIDQASRAFSVYQVLPNLDIPMHFVGGIAIGYFLHISISTAAQRGLIRAPDRLTRSVLLVALVASTAVFWEFAEFAFAYSRGTHGHMGLPDTLLDLLLGIVGGGCLTAVLWRAQ